MGRSRESGRRNIYAKFGTSRKQQKELMEQFESKRKVKGRGEEWSWEENSESESEEVSEMSD
jgi:hypothetical protein